MNDYSMDISSRSTQSGAKQSRTYLVVRLGKIYDLAKKKYLSEDPIEEIDGVLKDFQSCLFAKFGKPLNLANLSAFIETRDLHLVVAYKVGEQYASKTYKVRSAFNVKSSDRKNYPAYYKSKENFIGTWLEVVQSTVQVPLNSLLVASSYQKLLTSMSSSSSSYFFCKQ